MLDVIVFIMHKDLNAALSWLVFLEDNSLLLLAVNPITLLGQGGVFCANIFGRSEKITLCGCDPKRAYFRIFQQIKKFRNFCLYWKKHVQKGYRLSILIARQ